MRNFSRETRPLILSENSNASENVTEKLNSRSIFDTLTVKQWEIMVSNDVLLFSSTNEETPYEQHLHYCLIREL